MTLEEEMRMMRKYDREEGRKEGIEIGIEKGKEEGIGIGQKKIILNMIAQGFTDRQILSCVPEYTEEKLEELRETHSSVQAS